MDEIQKILVTAGRKDLAQKYYEKIANSNYNEFKGSEIPQNAKNFLESKNKNSWYNIVKAFFKGSNAEEATDWIIVTDDGSYYKVYAKYMIWFKNGARAIWTNKHLKVALGYVKRDQNPPVDPDYQT